MTAAEWFAWYGDVWEEVESLADAMKMDPNQWDRDDCDMLDVLKDITAEIHRRREVAREKKAMIDAALKTAAQNTLQSPQETRTQAQRPQSRECAAIGCGRVISARLLMCPAHWRIVPAPIKAEVLKHYRVGQEKDGKHTRQYADAMTRAIEAVAAREGKLQK